MSELDQQRLGELLSAYLDDELDAEQAQAVQRIVAQDPQARRLLDDLRRTRGALAVLPRHRAPHSILQDLESQLERAELLGAPEEGPITFSRGTSPLRWLSMAAMVAITVIGGTWVIFSGRERGDARLALQLRQEAETEAPSPETDAPRARPEQERRRPSVRDDNMGPASLGGPADRTFEESLAAPGAGLSPRDGVEEGDAVSTLPDAGLMHGRPLRLRFTVGSEAEGARLFEALASASRSYRLAGGSPGHSTAPQPPTDGTKRTHRRDAKQGFDSASNTILVRVPARRIQEFATELQRLGGDRDVALSAEPFEFRGWKETRFALVRAGDSAGAARRPNEAEPGELSAPEKPFSERLAWLTEALDALRVDQAERAALPASAGEKAAFEPAGPAPDEQVPKVTVGSRLADAAAPDGEQGAGVMVPATVGRAKVSAAKQRPSSSAPSALNKGEREGTDDDALTLVPRRRTAARAHGAGTKAPDAEPKRTPRAARDGALQPSAEDAFITLAIELEIEKPRGAKVEGSPRSAREGTPEPLSSDRPQQ